MPNIELTTRTLKPRLHYKYFGHDTAKILAWVPLFLGTERVVFSVNGADFLKFGTRAWKFSFAEHLFNPIYTTRILRYGSLKFGTRADTFGHLLSLDAIIFYSQNFVLGTLKRGKPSNIFPAVSVLVVFLKMVAHAPRQFLCYFLRK